MKKTLIALAVATSAVVSGSALAWNAGNANGSVDFGGTITPDTIQSPWEVKIGAGLTGLDSNVASGVKSVDINLPNDALVLGIRSDNFFNGGVGLAPQINYSGKIGNSFSQGKVDLTLDVKDASTDSVIGTLTTKLTTAAMGATKSAGATGHYFMWAGQAGQAYFGGLSNDVYKAATNAEDLANKIDPSIVEKWEAAGDHKGGFPSDFSTTDAQYNSFYISAVQASDTMTIALDQAPTSSVTWTASLPVIVTYQ